MCGGMKGHLQGSDEAVGLIDPGPGQRAGGGGQRGLAGGPAAAHGDGVCAGEHLGGVVWGAWGGWMWAKG